MTHILLRDWADERKCFLLDPETGATSEIAFPTNREADTQKAAGFGALLVFGLFRRQQTIFVALYTDQQTMLLQIGDQIFDCTDTTLRIVREAIAPFVKKFRVLRGEAELVSLNYFFSDFCGTFPSDPDGDFLTYIVHEINTPNSIRRFIYFWTARIQGREVGNQKFVDEMEKYIQGFSDIDVQQIRE